MDLGLTDKVVIVTGGSRGIGRAISELLNSEGAIPVIVGRDADSVRQSVEELKQKTGRAFGAIAELTDKVQCEQAVARITKQFGRIDGLVNNAGVNDSIGLEDGSVEAFERSLRRNVVHYYQMAQLCLPYLKESKGAIVNIGSKVAETGQGGTSGYAAANGGRNALTREWAVELLPYSIRVNSVIVAESMTPLYKSWLKSFPNPEQKQREIENRIPLQTRMTRPEEIANMVVFLLSEKSSHTTGQLIYVDGGYRHLDRAITKTS